MMTYLQVKAERAFMATALMTVWGTLMAMQGAVLVIYPLYRTIIHYRGYHAASPPAELQ